MGDWGKNKGRGVTRMSGEKGDTEVRMVEEFKREDCGKNEEKRRMKQEGRMRSGEEEEGRMRYKGRLR